MHETIAMTVEPYVGIDGMSPKETEKRSQYATSCPSEGKDRSTLDELTQSLRNRGTDITSECDYPDIEDVLNRILVWEPRESRPWPDLAVFGEVRVCRKLKRKPRVVHGCFDPASYAHLDDHCLYAVMFRSLTGADTFPERYSMDTMEDDLRMEVYCWVNKGADRYAGRYDTCSL